MRRTALALAGLVTLTAFTPAPTARPVEPAVAEARKPAAPGDSVTWTPWPVQQRRPGFTGFAADVVDHLPARHGRDFDGDDLVTTVHETTHAVHAELRTRHRRPAFYVGGGRAALVRSPQLTLRQAGAAVPKALRGTRFKLYFVKQARDWNDEPLYVWDEWVAYTNGARAGLTLPAGGDISDVAAAPLEFCAYGLAVAAAARDHDPDWLRDPQVREFLAHELRRACWIAREGLALPNFRWDTAKLEAALLADPSLNELMDELYGSRLTLARLLARP